jgi:UDP-N-acetylglucosamine--N-acetylmuramyl-(pentapeptide) pyrophosphoryl-undecaprenol N-acetylglucosamine transferase
MKILIAGGGTGGHLIPGIALYEEFKSRNIECRYVLRSIDLRYEVASRIQKHDRIEIEISGVSRRLSLKTPIYILKLARVFFKTFRLIRKFKPDAIIITGGYVSNPSALSALLLRKPLFILEQNSVAGVTNRAYSRFARTIFTAFPDTKRLKSKQVVRVGTPSIFKGEIPQSEARKFFNLERYKRIVGVTGGSQGAMVINDAVFEILSLLNDKGIGVIWSVGAVDYERVESKIDSVSENLPNLRYFRFIERMDAFFCASDCVISRGGATSIAEIIRYKTPSILIPIANSPDNHQYLNCLYLRNADAGTIIEENELSSQTLFSNILQTLKSADKIRENLKNLALDNPAKKIADLIIPHLSTKRG